MIYIIWIIVMIFIGLATVPVINNEMNVLQYLLVCIFSIIIGFNISRLTLKIRTQHINVTIRKKLLFISIGVFVLINIVIRLLKE